jgi:hypothetical protein
MLEGFLSAVKSKEVKQVIFLLGATVLVLTAVNHYHNIKLSRLKIEEMEKKSKA